MSRHSVVEPATKIRRGLSIYKTNASPFWMARIRNAASGRNVVRSTQERSKVKARVAAEELAQNLVGEQASVAPHYSFKRYAFRYLEHAEEQVAQGLLNANYLRTLRWTLQDKDWGLLRMFARRDVHDLRTHHWNEFVKAARKRKPDLKPSTLNSAMAAFRNVLKVARDEGVIDTVPATPRPRQQDNPRPYFRFDDENNEYKRLLEGARELAEAQTKVRGAIVTEELRDLIMFCVHSFVRPSTTELFAIRHRDVTVARDGKSLNVVVADGKTGRRVATTLTGAVAVWKRIKARNTDATSETYLFWPSYENRSTASRLAQRQFLHLLATTGLKVDRETGQTRTLYSLRHTAICMRLVKSAGRVNIYVLAKNAGTSVDQIERFYAKQLPIGEELIENLQQFG